MEEEDLLAADRLISIGKLSGSLAHELNNLLTGILVFAESLSKSTLEPQREDSMEILTAARRATDLLKGFVQLSRGVTQGGLGSLLENLRLLLHYRAHLSAMRFEVALPEPVPEVLGAAAELQHLLVHLVLRAIEQGEPGQTIRLTVSSAGEEAQILVECVGQALAGSGRAWLPKLRQSAATAEELARRLGGRFVSEEGGTLVAWLPLAGGE